MVTINKASNRIAIRPFRAGDAAGVRSVLEATYVERATPASTYDWWSFGCPEACSGFMVAEADGRIVGVQPMEVMCFADGPIKCTGGLLTGAAVHPGFRRRGVFSALVNACEREAWRRGAAFVTTMPNDKSCAAFMKLGYIKLGLRRLLARPLRPATMGGKAVPVLGHLAGAGGGLVQAALKHTLPMRFSTGVYEVSSVPPEIERLAQAHEERFPGLRIRRTADWLRWRFLESPLRKYRFFESRNFSGKLTGFAAAATHTHEKFKVWFIMDVLVHDDADLAALVAIICKTARAEKADAIATVVSSDWMASRLCRAGLWQVPQWLPLKKFYSVVRFNPELGLPAQWQTLSGWYQTLADWDNL